MWPLTPVVGSYVSNNAGMDVHMVALMQQASGYCVGVLVATPSSSRPFPTRFRL